MRCRKNVKSLDQDAKDAFIQAIDGLKLADSVLHPGSQSRYDDYVEIHRGAMDSALIEDDGSVASPGWGHFDSAFFPWHRELLYRFEQDLRTIRPDVTIPYWDWTRGQAPGNLAWPFTHDFLGVDGTDASQDRVLREAGAPSPYPHEFDPEAWTIVVTDNPGDATNLRRAFGERADAPGLPQNGVTVTGTNTNFRAAIAASTYLTLRARSEDLHNLVHRWANRTMISGSSPNDPVFWMHHANIDRMWSIWQKKNPALTPYVHSNGFAGHGLNDVMVFHEPGDPSPWVGTATPAQMIDGHGVHGADIWYASDLPEIVAPDASISFGDVPQGLTLYRAVRFETRTCRQLRFRVTGVPGGNFGLTDLGAQFILEPDLAATSVDGLVWVQFVANGASPQFSSMTIEAYIVDDEGYFATTEGGEHLLGTYTIALSANVVPREDNSVVLVLDRSGSMAAAAGGSNTRAELMKSAVGIFHALLRPTDEIGIVSFDDVTADLLPLTDQASGLGSTLTGSGLDPRGATGIGLGIQAGAAMLTGADHSNRSLLVLTDGNQNVHPYVEELPAGTLTNRTYAIGFGLPGQVSDETLNAITQNTQGDLVVTGLLGTDQERYLLSKYFVQMLAGITRTNIILDPEGELLIGSEHSIKFRVAAADISVDVILLSSLAPFVDLILVTPDGTKIDPDVAAAEPNLSFHLHPQVTFYRVDLPALPAQAAGSHAGEWQALLRIRGEEEVKELLARNRIEIDWKAFRQLSSSRSITYSCIVHARSNLDFSVRLSQASFEPGSRIGLTAALREYGIPFAGEAVVGAEVTGPDGPLPALAFAPEGGGRYSAEFVASGAGLYRIRVRARGATRQGSAFTREKSLTASSFAGRGGETGGPCDPCEPPRRKTSWLRGLIDALFGRRRVEAYPPEPAAPRGAARAPDADRKAAEAPVADFAAHLLVLPETKVDWPDAKSRQERAAKNARIRAEMAHHADPGLMMFPPFDDEGRAILKEHGSDCPPDCEHESHLHKHDNCPPDCDDETHGHDHDHDHEHGHDRDHGHDGDHDHGTDGDYEPGPDPDRPGDGPPDGGHDHGDDGHEH